MPSSKFSVWMTFLTMKIPRRAEDPAHQCYVGQVVGQGNSPAAVDLGVGGRPGCALVDGARVGAYNGRLDFSTPSSTMLASIRARTATRGVCGVPELPRSTFNALAAKEIPATREARAGATIGMIWMSSCAIVDCNLGLQPPPTPAD